MARGEKFDIMLINVTPWVLALSMTLAALQFREHTNRLNAAYARIAQLEASVALLGVEIPVERPKQRPEAHAHFVAQEF